MRAETPRRESAEAPSTKIYFQCWASSSRNTGGETAKSLPKCKAVSRAKHEQVESEKLKVKIRFTNFQNFRLYELYTYLRFAREVPLEVGGNIYPR